MKRALSLVITTAALLAQQPPVTNAKLETARAAAGLEQAVRAAVAKQAGPAWIGYAVARIPSDGDSCCWSNNSYGCGLEGQRQPGAPVAPAGPVKLEGPTHENVLLRVEGGTIGKVRSFSMDCPLDAGGLESRRHVDEHDACVQLAIHKPLRRECGDATKGRPDDERRRRHRLDHLDDVPGEVGDLVAPIGRPVTVAVAPQVERHGLPALFREGRCCLGPGVTGLSAPMQ